MEGTRPGVDGNGVSARPSEDNVDVTSLDLCTNVVGSAAHR